MFLDNGKQMVIGFELNKDYSQLSFCALNQSMPDTLSLVTGMEEYAIPTALAGRRVEDTPGQYKLLWSVGKDTRSLAPEDNLFIIDNLLDNLESDTSVVLGDEEFMPDQLLCIYLKKCFSLLVAAGHQEDVVGIAITSEALSGKIMQTISQNFTQVPVFFLNRQECFYQYMLHQPQEMWMHDCLLFEYQEDFLLGIRFEHNPMARPVVCMTTQVCFEGKKKLTFVSETEKQNQDTQLSEAIDELSRGRAISCTFLLGDGFSRDWCRQSLNKLCRFGRVFQGNNLYSKGACYGARERVSPSSLSTQYVYLGENKLRCNVGMDVCERGKDGYLPMLHAGVDWTQASYRREFILAKNNTLRLHITPVDGGKERTADITLDYFQIRGNATNRIELYLQMIKPDTLHVEVKDLGFGEIFPSRGTLWQDDLIIS